MEECDVSASRLVTSSGNGLGLLTEQSSSQHSDKSLVTSVILDCTTSFLDGCFEVQRPKEHGSWLLQLSFIRDSFKHPPATTTQLVSTTQFMQEQIGGIHCHGSVVGDLVTDHRDPDDDEWYQQKPGSIDALCLDFFLISETEFREASFGK